VPVPDHARDAVEELDDLEVPVQDGEQRPLVALVDGPLGGQEVDVGGDVREPLELSPGQRLEEGDGGDLVGRDHADSMSRLVGGLALHDDQNLQMTGTSPTATAP
jgi:hypothetical protein